MELGEYIYSDIEKNTYLISLYTNLIKKYAINIFKITDIEGEVSINVSDLLRFADILSKSTNDLKKQKHNNIAQNIVVLLKELYPENEEVKKIYVSVLNNIRNYRGIKENNYYSTDIREFISQYIEKELYKIEPNDDENYFVRDQKNIYDSLQKEKFYSYSGPTSMGKTFVIRKFIINQIKNNYKKNYVVVVPTKALISEITSDFITELNSLLKEKNYKVINTYSETNENDKYNYVMIYTQERLLSHLINSSIKVNYVFIDEAHKLFYKDTRTMYFYKILDILRNQDNVPNIYFSAPLIKNPNEFLDLLPEIGTKSSSVFEFTPVNQQKFMIDYNSKNIRIYNDLSSNFIELEYDKIEKFDINYILNQLGENRKNLVYCESKKEAINYALEYSKNRKPIEENEYLNKVKKYIKDEIHEDYWLIDMLSKGVAYHIGYIPNSIRKHIENLYKKKTINTIFCTSTLLEGVNLPADNLFINVKDKAKIISNEIDFKNLIGRVGRIKYNLIGNVFIIPNGSPKLMNTCTELIENDVSDKELSIKKVLSTIAKKEIINKLKNGDTLIDKRSKTYDEYESTRYIMNNLIDDIMNDRKGIIYKQFEKFITKQDIREIKEQFREKTVPQDLPITTDQIDKVDKYIKEDKLEYPDKITYNNVLTFLKELHEYYSWNIYEDKTTIGHKNNLAYYAVILQQWMLGFGIKQIIQQAIKYHEDNNTFYDINFGMKVDYTGSLEQKNSIINETLNAIENIILFKISNYFSKFSSRYKEVNKIDEIANDWYEYIQYGTNDKIVIMIQKIGFSREAALKINKKGYWILEEDKLYIKSDIFLDSDELLREEAKAVQLNNYYKFK
mgnify:FL=1